MKSVLSVLSFLFFLVFTVNSYAQVDLSVDDVEIVNLGDNRLFGRHTEDKKAPLEGAVRIITGYSAEYLEAEFNKGLAVGTWNHYKDKLLLETTHYKDGNKEGEQVSYYPRGGTVKSSVFFVNGNVEGTITRYFQNGQKEYEKTVKNGLDEGPERSYSEDGTVRSETIFKGGKAEGKSFSNYSSSRGRDFMRTSYYKGGKLDGAYSETSLPDGAINQKGFYVNGQKDGLWEKYEEGVIKLTEVYKAGGLVKKITYYTNGNPEEERNMKNGRDEGLVKRYDFSGEVKSELNYVNGKQVGKQVRRITSNEGNFMETTTYNGAGLKDGDYSEVSVDTKIVKVKGSYLKGEKHGLWIYRFAADKPYREELYENGTLKESKDIH